MRALRSIALVVVVALVTSLAWARQAPQASALTPQDVTTLVNTLDGTSNSLQSWTQGLGSVGQLASALPAVQTSAGSVLHFQDLLDKWFNNGTKKLSAATSDSDLNIDEDMPSLGGSDTRTGHLTSAIQTLPNGDRQLDFTITAHNTLTNQPLNIPVAIGAASNAPSSAFSSQGGVSLTVDATLIPSDLGQREQHRLLHR
jgi:hypothetical protein